MSMKLFDLKTPVERYLSNRANLKPLNYVNPDNCFTCEKEPLSCDELIDCLIGESDPFIYMRLLIHLKHLNRKMS